MTQGCPQLLKHPGTTSRSRSLLCHLSFPNTHILLSKEPHWSKSACQKTMSDLIVIATTVFLKTEASPGCSTLVVQLPAWTWESSRRRLKYVGPCAKVGDLEAALDSWLWANPNPAIVATCRINQWTKDLSLFLCLYNSVFKKNNSLKNKHRNGCVDPTYSEDLSQGLMPAQRNQDMQRACVVT